MRACLLGFLGVLLVAGVARGQDSCELPTATVGVPYVFDWGLGLQELNTSSDEFSFTVTLSGGTLPPGISLSSSGLFSGVPTAPGPYNAQFTWTFTFTLDGTTYPIPIPAFPCSIQVEPGSGPQLTLEPVNLVFTFVPPASTQNATLTLSNRTGQPRTFTLNASTVTGGNWLTVSAPSSTTVAPYSSAPIVVQANSGVLGTGTFVGKVTVTVAGEAAPFVIPVTTSLNGGQQGIQLPQTGFYFTAMDGSNSLQSLPYTVANLGTGSLNWSVRSYTATSGSTWLSSSKDNPGQGQVQVNTTNLAAGDYYGQVEISAPGVANSPQSMSVVLSVQNSSPNALPKIQPTGLIFVASGSYPAQQSVRISNLGSQAFTFGTDRIFEAAQNWFTTTVSNGTVSPGQSIEVPIQIAATGLPAAGVYHAQLGLRIIGATGDSSLQRIDVVLIVAPGSLTASKESAGEARNLAASCPANPTRLIPVFTQLGSNFSAKAAWPTQIELGLVDDCGNSISAGNVVATFTNGDPPLPLVPLGQGRWTATWVPHTAADQVTVTAHAQTLIPLLSGTAAVGGGAPENTTTPVISSGGIVSIASYAYAPVAPGSLVGIFGSNLSDTEQTLGLPFGTEFADTQVLIGGRELPLQFVGHSQINGVIPFDIAVNTPQQVIVRKGNAFSVPENVTLIAAHPSVFLIGPTAGAVLGVHPDGTIFVVSKDTPLAAHDYALIFCDGLGPVDPPVPAGQPASDNPLSWTTNPIQVTIGGVDLKVDFSGLTPYFSGMYQINVQIPEGITPSDTSPLIVSVNGQDSPPVTVAVK
jgi:uncharacterized protein (TIGR03437 family)